MSRWKLGGRVGRGIFCHELPININFRLEVRCRVFQAGVAANRKVVDTQINEGPELSGGALKIGQ